MRGLAGLYPGVARLQFINRFHVTVDVLHGKGSRLFRSFRKPDQMVSCLFVSFVVLQGTQKEAQTLLGGALFPAKCFWRPRRISGAFFCQDPDGGPEESDVSPKEIKYPPIPFEKLEAPFSARSLLSSLSFARDFSAFRSLFFGSGFGSRSAGFGGCGGGISEFVRGFRF